MANSAARGKAAILSPLYVPGVLACILATTAAICQELGPAGATGATISITAPDTGNVAVDNSLALDAAGNPVVGHVDQNDRDLKVLHCNDPTCSGDDDSITSPDTKGDIVGNVSLVLDASGNPVVSYHDLTNRDLKVLHCNDPNCAGGDERITSPDTDGNVGRSSSLVLDASGNPVVSYWYLSGSDLRVMHCNDPDCSGGDESITSPDTAGAVGRLTSLALDGGGNPVVSYWHLGNRDLKVLHCNDPNCAGGDESITSPDTVGDVGRFSSLVLDASGYPVISYYDTTNTDLKLLHCNDPNCIGGDDSIASPDTEGDVGRASSLALDASGYPFITYYDATNGDLKLLHCNDPNCSGGDEDVTSPDAAGDVGWFPSLALDASGNPVVAYRDDTNGDLKLLHCSTEVCDPDIDGDHCPDVAELQTAPRSEATGGLRDPKNRWDFADMPTGSDLVRDGVIFGLDILVVVQRFGSHDTGTGPFDRHSDPFSMPNPATGDDRQDYHPAYDRTVAGPHRWNLGPADGEIYGQDIGAVVGSFGHACA